MPPKKKKKKKKIAKFYKVSALSVHMCTWKVRIHYTLETLIQAHKKKIEVYFIIWGLHVHTYML